MSRQSLGSASIRAFVVVTLVLGGVLLATWQWSFLSDSVRAQLYKPTDEMQRIMTDIQLTRTGERYFEASQPELLDAESFNRSCGDHEKTEVVLGCYVLDRIYVYNVQNSDIDGIKQVTAAHELLHAAYHRLRGSEKNQVNSLLTAEANKRAGDSSFAERMSVYDGLSSEEKLSELHSVFGTEADGLSNELEQYYAQYFQRRAAIVTLYNDYSSVFAEQQQESDRLVQSYNETVVARNALVGTANKRSAALQEDIATFEASHSTTQVQADMLQAKITTYNTWLQGVRAQIKVYDAKLASLKTAIDSSVAAQQKLNESIDSSFTSSTTVQ